ncbi:MAG: hypothetical protein Q8L27_01505 [archaeon]|nr:hypothetical protein [archaeon]
MRGAIIRGISEEKIDRSCLKIDEKTIYIHKDYQEPVRNYLRDRGFHVDLQPNVHEGLVRREYPSNEEQEKFKALKLKQYDVQLCNPDAIDLNKRKEIVQELETLVTTEEGKTIHYLPSKLVSELGLRLSEIAENSKILGNQKPFSKGYGYSIYNVIELLKTTLSSQEEEYSITK